MRQTSVPPGRECSILKVSEPGEQRKRVRTISHSEQQALEHAPTFDTFCDWLYRLAQAAQTRQNPQHPPEAA